MKKTDITKAMILLVLAAVIFSTGLYFGRTGAQGGFTVTTQYQVGAVSAQELGEIAQRVDARAARDGGDTQGEAPAQAPGTEGGLININTAGVNELTTLAGIGPAIAERIIAHREANGPFRIIEEITDVSGIGERRFEDIRSQITVED